MMGFILMGMYIWIKKRFTGLKNTLPIQQNDDRNLNPRGLIWENANNISVKTVTIPQVEKALYRIFSSPDGHILWKYFEKTILENIVVDGDIPHLQGFNGKRTLVLQLKSLALRAKK